MKKTMGEASPEGDHATEEKNKREKKPIADLAEKIIDAIAQGPEGGRWR
jgi:hypothetical protein